MPCGEIPCGEIPCGDMPCGDIPCGEIPCGDMPCGDMPCGDMPCGDMPCSDIPWLLGAPDRGGGQRQQHQDHDPPPRSWCLLDRRADPETGGHVANVDGTVLRLVRRQVAVLKK